MSEKKYISACLSFFAILVCSQVMATTPVGGVAGSLTVTNCLIYNNDATIQTASTNTVTYSAIEATTAPTGTGNQAITSSLVYKDAAAAPANTTSYYLAPTSSLTNAGTTVSGIPAKDINGNDRTYDGTNDIGAVEYSEIYQNGTNNWSTSSHWNIGRCPTADDIVTIRSACQVTSTDAVCKKLIAIENGATLTINPTTQLVVSETITNSDQNKLIIAASATQANGSLIFHNPTATSVYATVQMYSKADVLESETNTDAKYQWQYFGIPVKTLVANPTFYGSWVRRWDETLNQYSKWVQLTNSDELQSFTGYEVVNPDPTFFTFQGALENGDKTISLSKSNVPYYPGQYVLANPYAAAINIANLTFSGDAEATIYIYNTGSYSQWAANTALQKTGSGPGQYLSIPQAQAATLGYTTIPSMQGFVVRIKNEASIGANGSITIPYSSVVQNTTQQRVKESSTKSFLNINVEGERSADRMWLFSESTATHNFDNGWDGYKMMANKGPVQLFAAEAAGNFQVNSVNDVNNTFLGFRAGDDVIYTLKLANHNMNSLYSHLYLLDLVENKVIDITSDSTEYSFTASNTSSTERRFKIVSQRVDDPNALDETLLTVYSTDKNVLIHNFTNESGKVTIYDLFGHLICQKPFGLGINSVTLKYSGIYIIKAEAGSHKLSTKIIVR